MTSRWSIAGRGGAGGGPARRRVRRLFAAAAIFAATTALTAGVAALQAPASAAAVAAHDPIGIIVTGDLVRAPDAMKTYSGNAYWLSTTELAAVKAAKGASGPHADLWTSSKYSFCEDHGTAVHGWATAAGIGLTQLLEDAGLTAAEIGGLSAVKVTSAVDGYSAALDLTQTRWLFKTLDGAGDPVVVKPMLALYSSEVDEADGYAALPDEATTAVDGDYARLMFGQLTTAESNQCNYVADASLIALPESSPAFVVDASDKFSSGRQKTMYSLADLVSGGNGRATYAVSGRSYTCDGLDMHTLLADARGAICPQDRVIVTTSGGAQDLGAPVADVTAGAYLLSYYSQDGTGAKVENGTQVMLYSDGAAIGNVLSVTIEHVAATAGLVVTSPTVSQRSATVSKGMKLALRAVAVPANGATQADAVTWTSSAPAVATVGSDGTVSARSPGTATISAASDACRKRFTVKVVARKRAATRVTLPRAKSLSPGAGTRLAVRLRPATATTTISWRSSRPAVATVDRAGRIIAVKNGRATITVRTDNGKIARCALTVK